MKVRVTFEYEVNWDKSQNDLEHKISMEMLHWRLNQMDVLTVEALGGTFKLEAI